MRDTRSVSYACVTGASGFIGSHIVARLLEEGFEVRGTVRDVNAPRSGFLSDLPGAERLTLHQADLTRAESFVSAVRGCEVVFHVASPVTLDPDDGRRDVIDPALALTEAVLEAAAEAPSVRRVVLTSSVAAVGDARSGVAVGPDSWNASPSPDTDPYGYAKTMAERSAWEFVERRRPGFDLVAINPAVVLGPALGPRLAESLRVIRELYGGRFPAIIDLALTTVDVRDVALAHIAAARLPGASGRYIVATEPIALRRIVEVAARVHPSRKLPRLPLDNPFGTRLVRLLLYTQPPGVRRFLEAGIGRPAQYDTTKTQRELGISFRPVEETIADTITDQIERGHI